MALQSFTDNAGRQAFKDDSGMVYTNGGNTATNYNVNNWNKRQSNKYGSSSSSTSSGSSNNLDMQSIINNAIKMQQDAIKPAVNQLQNSVGSTGKNFDTQISQLEANKQPLQDRYNSLIDTLKGNQTTAENRQTMTTNNELGKRGIPLTSGVAQQEVTNAVNPVTQQYTGLIKDTGFQENADLKSLTDQITNLGLSKTDSINAINQAIAQLQSGAGQQGIQTGLGIYGTNLNQSNADRTFQQSQAQLAQQQTQWNEYIKSLGSATPQTQTGGTITPNISDLSKYTYGNTGFDTAPILNTNNPSNSTYNSALDQGANKMTNPLDSILYSNNLTPAKSAQTNAGASIKTSPLNNILKNLFSLGNTSYQ